MKNVVVVVVVLFHTLSQKCAFCIQFVENFYKFWYTFWKSLAWFFKKFCNTFWIVLLCILKKILSRSWTGFQSVFVEQLQILVLTQKLDWFKANAFQIKLIYLNCIFSVSSDFFCQKYLGKTSFPNQLAKDEILWSGFSVFSRIFRSFRGTWSPRHDWIYHVILRDFCVKFFTFFWWNSKIFWCNLSYKVSSWVAWK